MTQNRTRGTHGVPNDGIGFSNKWTELPVNESTLDRRVDELESVSSDLEVDVTLLNSLLVDPGHVYFSGSEFSWFGGDIITSGSIYVGGQIQGSGSLVLDTSHDRHVSGDYTYGIFNSATYTGSFRGYVGLSNINTYAPNQQNMNGGYFPYQYGINNLLYHNNSYTSSGLYGLYNSTRIQSGYITDGARNIYLQSRIWPGVYVGNYSSLEVNHTYGGTEGNHYGVLLLSSDLGGTVDNIYGLYIDSSYFPATINSQSYAIYSEPNVPSYFGGQIQGSGSLVLDTSENRFENTSYSYGIDHRATYTGSKNMFGFVNSNTHAPEEADVSTTGISNSTQFSSSFSGSNVAGINNSTSNWTFTDSVMGIINTTICRSSTSTGKGIHSILGNLGYIEAGTGLWVQTNAAGGQYDELTGIRVTGNNAPVNNTQYGIHIDDLFFSTNSIPKYSIYSEPNVPSYFGGPIEIANRLRFVNNPNGFENIIIGSGSGTYITTSSNHVGNTILGEGSLNLPFTESNIIIMNVAVGKGSLGAAPAQPGDIILSNRNVAVGLSSMANMLYGEYNTAIGTTAMLTPTSGSQNVAVGFAALGGLYLSNLGVGDGNTAIGRRSLQYNIGSYNTSIGSYAGQFSTSSYSIYVGSEAGYDNTRDHTLFIGSGSNSLIYGEMDTQFVSLQATTSSVTPHASGSIAFQLDESNNKLMFQIKYSDGTIHSASADIY